MPDFQNPAALLLLLFVPLLCVARKLRVFSGVSFPLTFFDWNGESFEWTGKFHQVLSVLTEVFCFIAYTCLVLAFAAPVSHHQERVYTSRGADIMFVIDTSPSMASHDIANGMRLDAAKQVVRTLVNDNYGTSFAIVEMGSEAAVVVPPTTDHNIFLNRLDTLCIGEMGDGSAIGTGLATAIYHLISSTAPKKCVILITDGENNAGAIHPNTAARMAKDNNISLYVLGLGTRGLVYLEYVDQNTGKVISGNLDSSFNAESLKNMVAQADGKYFGIENMSEFNSAINAIGKEQIQAQSYHIRNTDYYYYSVLLIISAILFAVAWILRRIYLRDLL